MKELFYSLNDTLPRIEVIVSGNGAATDLSNSTGIIFQYKPRYSGNFSVLSGQFSSKSSGIVYVDITGTTVTSLAGPNFGRFKMYFQNGGVLSYPNEGFINFETLSGAN